MKDMFNSKKSLIITVIKMETLHILVEISHNLDLREKRGTLVLVEKAVTTPMSWLGSS